MPTTKVKTTSLEDAISSAGQRIRLNRKAISAEVAALTARLSEVRSKAQDAEDGITHRAEVEAQWRRGEDVEPYAYAVALGEDARIADLAVFLPRRIESMTRNLTSVGTLLANHVAPAFGPVLPGVKIITTTAPYREWRSDVPADTVAVVIVEPLRRDVQVSPFTGERSGKVEVYYFRPGLYRPVEVSNLETTARNLGIAMTVTANRAGDESEWVTVAGQDNARAADPSATVVDTLTVQVDGVLDGLPIVRMVSGDSPLKGWCAAIFGENSRSEGYTSSHVNVQNPEEGGWRVTYGASTAGGEAPKVSEVVNDDGERTLTMRAVVNVSGVSVNAFVAALRECADNAVGNVDWNGILTEADVSLRTSGPSSVHAVDVVLTYRSQIPSGGWIAERLAEARQRDAAEEQQEARRAQTEEHREAALRRLHPAERAALSA